MGLIESKHINYLFSDLNQYGLRGNSALWLNLKNALSESDLKLTATGLIKWVNAYIKEHITAALTTEIEQDNLRSLNRSAFFDYVELLNHVNEKHSVHSIFDIDFLHKFVDAAINNPEILCDLYVDSFNHGGMSGGMFSLFCWKKEMLPILIQRCEQLEQGLLFRQENNINSALFIGDIHGQVKKLDALLSDYCWSSDDEQKLIFVGDLIDNALDSDVDHLALLNKIKDWFDNKQAFCLLGNHEFNAIGWFIQKADGSYCRDRLKAGNIAQHQLFIQQVGEDSAEHAKWINWFKTLPLFLNFGDITAIHACWHEPSIAKLRPYLNDNNSLKDEHWVNAFDEDHELHQLIETLLKGPEIKLPKGHSFHDKNGIERHDIRVAWWKNTYSIKNYQDLAVVANNQRQAIPTIALEHNSCEYNQAPLFPVVIGHYTLEPTPFPEALNKKVICVDFNAAKQNNPLVGLTIIFDDFKSIDETRYFEMADRAIPNRIIGDGANTILSNFIKQCPTAIKSPDFENYVAEILFKQWDPVGVYDHDNVIKSVSDEYLASEKDIIRLAQAGMREELAAYLLITEQLYYQVVNNDAEYRCTKVAYKLINHWQATL